MRLLDAISPAGDVIDANRLAGEIAEAGAYDDLSAGAFGSRLPYGPTMEWTTASTTDVQGAAAAVRRRRWYQSQSWIRDDEQGGPEGEYTIFGEPRRVGDRAHLL